MGGHRVWRWFDGFFLFISIFIVPALIIAFSVIGGGFPVLKLSGAVLVRVVIAFILFSAYVFSRYPRVVFAVAGSTRPLPSHLAAWFLSIVTGVMLTLVMLPVACIVQLSLYGEAGSRVVQVEQIIGNAVDAQSHYVFRTQWADGMSRNAMVRDMKLGEALKHDITTGSEAGCAVRVEIVESSWALSIRQVLPLLDGEEGWDGVPACSYPCGGLCD